MKKVSYVDNGVNVLHGIYEDAFADALKITLETAGLQAQVEDMYGKPAAAAEQPVEVITVQ